MKENNTRQVSLVKTSVKSLKGDFTTCKRFHFVGIGGSGMSSLALLLHAQGKIVSGSDLKLSKSAELLAVEGIRVVCGQTMEVIPEDVEVIVYSAAIPELDQSFFRKLKTLTVPLFEYHEAVGEYAKNKHTVAIAGTHGKTTTTAMVATILKSAGNTASALVGGVMADTGTSVCIGDGDTFVVEADEYRGGFLHLSPSILVITNIDHDHVNDFPTLADVQKVFKKLIKRIVRNGVIVTNPADPHIAAIIGDTKYPIIDYRSVSLEGVSLKLPGEHNRHNAQAALAAVGVLGVSDEIARKALSEFSGTGRRFEYKGKMKNGALVYDDYAHNPQKVRAVISGVREAFPDKKITIVFQPHLFTRTKAFLDDFAKIIASADFVIVTGIYAAREKMDLSITSKDLLDKVRVLNKKSEMILKFEEIVSVLSKRATAEDIIVTVGAGDITTVSDMLVAS